MQVLVSPLAGPGSVACRLVVRRFGHTRGAGSGMQAGASFCVQVWLHFVGPGLSASR